MMKLPAIQGVIRRRLLLNYRVAPEAVAAILPPPLRPKLVKGHAIAGICLIRLEQLRPKGFPAWTGVSSENSAHRIAVEWEKDGEGREGVFVPRRDTDSFLTSLAGGRIFPGVQNHSRFEVRDVSGDISMKVSSGGEESTLVAIEASEADEFPVDSVFASLEESSSFFEGGCVGYSSRPDGRRLEGLVLKVTDWQVKPLRVGKVKSSYFDDRKLFSSDQIHFDHALLMRDISHHWLPVPDLETA